MPSPQRTACSACTVQKPGLVQPMAAQTPARVSRWPKGQRL